MDEFTRKFNTAEDKEQQIHHILTAVYDVTDGQETSPDGIVNIDL